MIAHYPLPKLKDLPSDAGVYFMRDRTGEILYIGKAKNLRKRVSSYFAPSQRHSNRIALMVSQIRDIDFIVTDTEAEALALEANLIKQHQPHFNVLLKDDKKYPYVCITWSEKYPRIFITRKRRVKSRGDRYYGPYTDTRGLRHTLDLIKGNFALRQRPKPLHKDRPCLNYDMGKCPGVCQNLISSQEYRQTIQKIALIFQGRTNELISQLRQQMEKAAENLDFEKAAKYRDQIHSLEQLFATQKVALPDDTISQDAIALAQDEQHTCIQLFQIRAGRLVGRLGFYTDNGKETEAGEILQRVLEQHYQQIEPLEIPSEILVQHPLEDAEMLMEWLGEKTGKKITIINPQRQIKAELIAMVEKNAHIELEKTQKSALINLEAMEDLAQILGLKHLPKHIEGYDISHLQGSNAVASRVVFIDGQPAKQYYRHYKIKNPTITIGHSDDFLSLQEVIRRRFSGNDPRPDLIMIDGGKGQLSAVCEVLEELTLTGKLKVISLAKKREEIFLPKQSQPLPTDAEQAGVQLLRRLRDEAHRFAVTFHRQQRLKASRRSQLDQIPGLGFERQKRLLAHFHSVDYIREASVKQIQAVDGIGVSLAENIYDYFHPS
ncbi:Excinuclease ABC subunit C [Cyanobacterium stanieri PCC 7202]|uniref:UvrABC system protein C n=1 Tax=Cyanobacterium stanieri (strain ATCC 29140 / PCC 7202) TaxID=292563 RepID=K9YLG3_CYASC|nr:Excinuclease ABC subunit C [Cyanobacterium stanieri PCC 7202]